MMVHGLTGTLNDRQGLTRVYMWEPVTNRFSAAPVQVIQTKVVKDSKIMIIQGTVYLLLASYYDHNSESFELRYIC